jgi:hypothetical protein
MSAGNVPLASAALAQRSSFISLNPPGLPRFSLPIVIWKDNAGRPKSARSPALRGCPGARPSRAGAKRAAAFPANADLNFKYQLTLQTSRSYNSQSIYAKELLGLSVHLDLAADTDFSEQVDCRPGELLYLRWFNHPFERDRFSWRDLGEFARHVRVGGIRSEMRFGFGATVNQANRGSGLLAIRKRKTHRSGSMVEDDDVDEQVFAVEDALLTSAAFGMNGEVLVRQVILLCLSPCRQNSEKDGYY